MIDIAIHSKDVVIDAYTTENDTSGLYGVIKIKAGDDSITIFPHDLDAFSEFCVRHQINTEPRA